jgi:hypothetical protein
MTSETQIKITLTLIIILSLCRLFQKACKAGGSANRNWGALWGLLILLYAIESIVFVWVYNKGAI